MATAINPGDEVFLDTSYAIALSAPTDQFHNRALTLATELEAAGARMVTTRAVLLEIGNALARQRYRAAAVRPHQIIISDFPNAIMEHLTGSWKSRVAPATQSSG
jgi:predicted nucleic acid-binding protein